MSLYVTTYANRFSKYLLFFVVVIYVALNEYRSTSPYVVVKRGVKSDFHIQCLNINP